MAQLNVFLDTMVYLHFAPVAQIDFCEIFGVDAVTILVPRVTFKELEKHKITHASERTRLRSRQALALLEEHFKAGLPIRSGVSFEFIPHMPRVDLDELGLNPLWNDDLLIASVLEYQGKKPSEETVLVTDDAGARVTCRHLGVRTFELPEKYRLAPEVDENEKEVRRLQREVQRLKNALPKIVVGFGTGMESVARFALEAPERFDESLIARTLSKLKVALPELPLKHDSLTLSADLALSELARALSASDVFGTIPDEEFQRYNKERLAYFENYRNYMRATAEAKNRATRSLRFTIALANAGSAPADDVDARLLFPDGFSLCAEEDRPASPTEPRRPTKPRSRGELMASELSVPNLYVPRMDIPNLGPPSTFQLRKTNSYELSDHFVRIKHGQTEELRELFLTFDSYDDAQSFHCQCPSQCR